jgi:magnesium transporter
MRRARHPELGARPGTLMLGPSAGPVQMKVTAVRGNHCTVSTCDSVADLPLPESPDHFVWIDVKGFGDGRILESLSRRFRISPLAMEDLVNTPQRPKMELFTHQQLIIAHTVPDAGQSKEPNQLGIVFDRKHVLTFHTQCDHVLNPIHQRLQSPSARLRRNGADYLVYAILDACVDGCYPILENLGEQIELLEHQVLEHSTPDLLRQIHAIKNLLARIRRSIWPQREMVQSLLATDSPFLTDVAREYLRDTCDHCSQLADVVDMYRESTTSLVNTYMSAVAHRSNEIMKVLTLLTSVFVPPTFLAGIYGMNFAGMPELNFPGAYPIALTLMSAMIAGTLLYFYQRGWLSSSPIAVSTQRDDEGLLGKESLNLRGNHSPERRLVLSDPDHESPVQQAA